MKRREKGEGGLTKRADGRYQATYVGSDGRVHYLYAATRKAAVAKLAAAMQDKERGMDGPSPLVTAYLERWLTQTDHVRDITRRRYEALVRLHASPAIGHLQLREVQPQHLADLYSALKGLRAPATIGQLHAVLHSAFDQALRWGMITRNPAAAVRAPKIEQREMRVLSLPDIHHFLTAIEGDDLEALYILAITTGARQGELLALRWTDIDLIAGTLAINATLTLGERLPPKTTASVRTLHLTDLARAAIRSHRRRMAERLLPLQKRAEGDVYVFLTPLGDPYNGFHITERHLKPLLRRAELPVIRFHDLRHVFASLMLSQGVRPDLVAQMLGHANPATTLRIYAHLMPGDQEAAMARLDAVLAG